MIVATPFAHAPRTRWVNDPVKQKAERLDMDIVKGLLTDSDDDDEDSQTKNNDVEEESSLVSEYDMESSLGEDDMSVSTEDSDDAEILDIEKLMKEANEKTKERLRNAVSASTERMKGEPMFNPLKWVYKKLSGHYNRWYERKRAERLHPVYRNYAKRIMDLDDKLKKDFEAQLAKYEQDVIDEAMRRQKRIIKSGIVKKRADDSLSQFKSEVDRRNEEARRQDFNCINMQRWAGDNYDRDEMYRAQANADSVKAQAKAHDDDVKAEIAADNGVIAEDIRLTQEVYRQMRVSGLKEGVNVKPKADAKLKAKKKPGRQAREVVLQLKEDAARAFKEWEPKHEQSKRQRDGNVFDINLIPLKFVKKIRCSKIGEKGALSLASDFVRGAAPQLQELDMSYCQIQTRGFMRLMHGIKIANLSGLKRLNVRGNDIGSRGAETLSSMLNLTIFENLSHIDMRDNELGDAGGNIIINMCLFGLLENVVSIDLGNNLITDQGFEALVNVFGASQPEKCPKLQLLGLSNNNVTPATKKKLDPFPIFIQP